MAGELFSYRIHKENLVRIFWVGRCVAELGGKRGQELASALEAAGEEEVQHLLQRVTGNFKRGNERGQRRR